MYILWHEGAGSQCNGRKTWHPGHKQSKNKPNLSMWCRRYFQHSWFYLKYQMLVMLSFAINFISLLKYHPEKQSWFLSILEQTWHPFKTPVWFSNRCPKKNSALFFGCRFVIWVWLYSSFLFMHQFYCPVICYVTFLCIRISDTQVRKICDKAVSPTTKNQLSDHYSFMTFSTSFWILYNFWLSH